jgi:hypothetical protein
MKLIANQTIKWSIIVGLIGKDTKKSHVLMLLKEHVMFQYENCYNNFLRGVDMRLVTFIFVIFFIMGQMN